MNITVKKATIDEKQTIHNLCQPYMDELSNFLDDDPEYKDKDGIYHYPYLDNYWQEESRFPYLFFSRGKAAGFVLVSYYRE